MKILHVYKSYYPDTVGGIEQVISQLGLALSRRGVESRIFTLSPNPEPPVLSYPEGEVFRSRQFAEVASNNVSLAAFRDFRTQLQWADVVHYQFPWPFGDLLHLACARGKPSVVSYQSDIVRQKLLMRLYRPLMNQFLNSVDAVVATSPEYHESSDVLACVRTPVMVIPNGVDESSYPVPAQPALQRWRARVGQDFMLFVGVLRYYKGLHVLLDAARGFEGQIVFAGEGPERDALEAKIRALQLDNVTLLGRVTDEDKMCLLQLCRALVFPSHLRSEAFGMSLVEAAMVGKPMISCGIRTGTSFINRNGDTGYVVPPEDAGALRSAMQRLHGDETHARALGRAARERYTSLFTGAAMAGSYEALYRKLMAAAAR